MQSKIEWGKLFDDKSAPLARVVWLKDTDVSDLILVCPHCICDGTTFVTLMSEMLGLLDKPEKELSSICHLILWRDCFRNHLKQVKARF